MKRHRQKMLMIVNLISELKELELRKWVNFQMPPAVRQNLSRWQSKSSRRKRNKKALWT